MMSVAAFTTSHGAGYALLAMYVVALARESGIPLSYLLRGLRPLLVVIVIAASFHLLFTPGETLWRIGPIGLSKEGAAAALHMTVRLVLMVTSLTLVTLTTTPLALTDGLERLLSPLRAFKLPVHEVAMMMAIALRFIPVLGDELEKIMKAQVARGADLESGGLLRRIRNLVPLLVPLFVSVFQRADELGLAMEARGYRGGEGRTRMKELHWTARDGAALLLTAFICLAATVLL